MRSEKPRYRSVAFEWIDLAKLQEHPDAAAVPMDDEDRAELAESIEELGVMDPLKVIADGDRYLVVDGCNRLTKLRGMGAEKTMCQIIETDDIQSVVNACLASGRKRSTGQRLIVYLEANWQAVLSAWSINQEKGENYRIARNLSKVSRETLGGEKGDDHWSAQAIAKRKHWCRDDVLCGISLLLAQDPEGARPFASVAGIPVEKYVGAAREQRQRVLSGGVPIRRWRSAVGSRAQTKGLSDNGRSSANYSVLGPKAAISLLNAFLNWGEVSTERPKGAHLVNPRSPREDIEASFGAMCRALPADLYATFHAAVEYWPQHEQRRLLAILKKLTK